MNQFIKDHPIFAKILFFAILLNAILNLDIVKDHFKPESQSYVVTKLQACGFYGSIGVSDPSRSTLKDGVLLGAGSSTFNLDAKTHKSALIILPLKSFNSLSYLTQIIFQTLKNTSGLSPPTQV